jgi:hypothetical protein
MISPWERTETMAFRDVGEAMWLLDSSPSGKNTTNTAKISSSATPDAVNGRQPARSRA